VREGCGQSDIFNFETHFGPHFSGLIRSFFIHFYPPDSLKFGPLLIAILDNILVTHRQNDGEGLEEKPSSDT
jgi:hypothetical protein